MDSPSPRLVDAVAYVAHRGNQQLSIDHLAAAITSASELVQFDRAAANMDGEPTWELATSLCALAEIQLGDGDNASAHRVIAECLGLVRARLSEAPTALVTFLCENLTFLGGWHYEQDDRAAVGIVGDAVDLHRQLVLIDPQTHTPGLAAALDHLSLLCEWAGDQAASVTAAAESVDLSRQLLATEPEGFLAVYAYRLSQLFDVNFKRGDREATLAAIAEEADIRRWLLASGDEEQAPEFTRALMRLAWEQEHVGDRAAAIRTLGEAIEIQARLANEDPDEHRYRLAWLLSSLSRNQYEKGHQQAAVATSAQALHQWTALIASDPLDVVDHLLEAVRAWLLLRPEATAAGTTARIAWEGAINAAAHVAVRAEIRATYAGWLAAQGASAAARGELTRAATEADSLGEGIDEDYPAKRRARGQVRQVACDPEYGLEDIDLPRWAKRVNDDAMATIDSFMRLGMTRDPAAAAPWIQTHQDAIFGAEFLAHVDDFLATEPELRPSLAPLRNLVTEVTAQRMPKERLNSVLDQWIQSPVWEDTLGFLDAINVLKDALTTAGTPLDILEVVTLPDRPSITITQTRTP
jgi:hypothetical protein